MGNLRQLLVGVQICTPTTEINMVIPQNFGNSSTSKAIYTIIGHTPKGLYILCKGHLLHHIHCSSIHNIQKLETH